MSNRISREIAAPSCRVAFLGLCLAYLLLQLPMLDRVPPIVIDESWYANTAHNLANGHGLINTNVGARGGDQFFLFPVVVSGAFKVAGTSLWIGRFVSVLLGLIALCGLGALCQKLEIRGWAFAVTGLLFIVSNVYYILFRRLRPEGLVIALSLWALFWFITAWQTGKFKPALASALLVGSSALAHPYGILLAVVFGILLAIRSLSSRGGVPAVLGYAMGGVTTVLIFLIGWKLLREQSVFDFLREASLDSGRLSFAKGSIASAFWANLTNFVPAYSLGLWRLYILVFEFGILVAGLARYRYDRLTGLLSLTGLLCFVAGLALWTPFQRWAFNITLIFALAVTGRLLTLGASRLSPLPLNAIWIVTLVYGLNNLAGDAYTLKRNANNISYTQLTQALDATVSDGVPVLTQIEFWFAFHDNPVYTQFRRWSTTPYSNLRELKESGNVRYVVLSAALTNGLSPTTGEIKGISEKSVRFYMDARMFAISHCERIDVLATHGYGDIEIWECAKKPRVN